MRRHAPVWVRSSGARLRPVRSYRDVSDLHVMSRDDVLGLLENWQIGYSLAMEYPQLTSLDELVETMHEHGRSMPGHRPMTVTKETLELLQQITRPLPKSAAE